MTLSIAVQLAVVREAEKRIKAFKEELGVMLMAAIEPGDTKSANLADGSSIGKFTYTPGSVRPFIADEAVFLQWVKDNHPEEISESVKPGFRERTLAVVKRTGELPPGVDLNQSAPYLRYVATKDSGDVLDSRWSELVGEVLQIEPAKHDAA